MTDTDDDELLRAIANAPAITPPHVERDARIGTTIRDKYTLDGVLGEGGMAIVYAATHRNAKRFAIKVLRQKFSTSEARQRFVREGYVANNVSHPGAVAILDDDVTEDGAAFLVMELLDGEPLDRLAKERLPIAAVINVALQVCDVLAAAHAKGIIHRDIKPQNVFVTRSGEVKVLDFGIARMRVAASDIETTQSGALLGTPAFMSPEQARGHTSDVDGRSDLWSAGATLFSLLAGRNVHTGTTGHEVSARAATQPAPKLESVADVPAGIARVVDRGLAFSKSARWPDAASMRDALDDGYVKAFGTPATRADVASLFSADRAPHPTARRSSRKVAWGVAVIVAVIAVVVGGGLAIGSRSRTPTHAVAATTPTSDTAAASTSAATVTLAPAVTESAMTEPRDAAIVVPRAVHAAPMASRVLPAATCDPPYTVDARGKRIPKPECL